MNATCRGSAGWSWVTLAAVIVLPLVAIWTAFCFAPTEHTMGHAQRIVYIHVPVAWLGLLGLAATAALGAVYLVRREPRWDHWAQAAVELGWVCCSLTLITGSLWAHEAWGTWWEWDPRLTTSFILWLIYCGILLVRGNVADPDRRARIGAILALLGTADIPLVTMATRWFRGLHPVSPEMDPSMRIALLAGVVGWTALLVWLVCQRRLQVGLEQLTESLRAEQMES